MDIHILFRVCGDTVIQGDDVREALGRFLDKSRRELGSNQHLVKVIEIDGINVDGTRSIDDAVAKVEKKKLEVKDGFIGVQV